MSLLTDTIRARAAQQALALAKAACNSRTLRDALKIVLTPTGFRLEVPHYWAKFFHDGRGAFGPGGGGKKLLVYYKNPAEDPRIQGGHPVQPARRLTKEEFYRDWGRRKLVVVPPGDTVGPQEGQPFLGKELNRRLDPLLRSGTKVILQKMTRDALGANFRVKITTTFGR